MQQLQQQSVGVTKLRLTDLNTHLICVLCGGYLIDATTIVECLHSFCRSCIIKYLEGSSFCPLCECQIHKAKPYRNLKPDKALQDIVYKLVPGLFHSEMRRRREFYAKHPEYLRDATTPEGRGEGVERLIYSPDDSISLSLEYLDPDIVKNANGEIPADFKTGSNKRYLQCPALVTISHLKKFLRYKFDLTADHVVEVIHRRESLPDDYTLLDVAYIYTWKRSNPMRFFYRIYEKGSMTELANLPSITGSTENTNGSSVTSCGKEEHNEQKEQPKDVSESTCASVEDETLLKSTNEDAIPAAEEVTTAPSAEEINPPLESHRAEEGDSKEDPSVSVNKSGVPSLTSGSVAEVIAPPKNKIGGRSTLSARIPRLKPGHRNGSVGKKPTAKVSLSTHPNVKRLKSSDEVQASCINVKDTAEAIVEDQSSHSHISKDEALSKNENEAVAFGSSVGEFDSNNSPGNAVKTPSTCTETPHSSTETTSSAVTKDEKTIETPSAESCTLSENKNLRDPTVSQTAADKNLEVSAENNAVVSSSSTNQVNQSPDSTKDSCSRSDNSDSGILVSPSSNLSETSSSAEDSPDNSKITSPSGATKDCTTPPQNSTIQTSLSIQNNIEQTAVPLQSKSADAPTAYQGSAMEEASILENHSAKPLLEQKINTEATRTAEDSSCAVSSEIITGDTFSSSSQATAAELSEVPQASASKGLSCQRSQSSVTQSSESLLASNSSVLTADETRKLSIEHSIDSKTMQVLKSECEIKNMYSTSSKPNQVSTQPPTKANAGSMENAKIAQNKNILWKKLSTPKTPKSSVKQIRSQGKTSSELINKLDMSKKEAPKTSQPGTGVDKQNLKNMYSIANNTKTPAGVSAATTITSTTTSVKEGDKTQATRNILKNNQQILKKNDEILRTVSSVYPYFKTQQKLTYQNIANLKRKQIAETWQKKSSHTQSQVNEDKSGAKKRRVMMSKDNATVTSNRNANTPMPNKPLMSVVSSGLTPGTSNSSVEKKPPQAGSHDLQNTKTLSSVTPSAQASQLGKRSSSALEVTSNIAPSKPGIETFKRIKTESLQNGDNVDTSKNMFCMNSNGLQIIPISRAQQESSVQNQSVSVAKISSCETKTTISVSVPNKSLMPTSESISMRPLNNKLYTKANAASKDKKLPNDSHTTALSNKSNSVNTVKQRTLNSVPAHASTTFAQPSPTKAAPKAALPQKVTENPSKSPRHSSQGSSPTDRQDITPPSLLGLLKQEKTSEDNKGSKASAKHDSFGALDLSASPRRAQHSTIVSIADTLARRQQLKCASPPPLSPLPALSPFPITPSLPVRSPPPSLRIPVPGSQQRAAPQQRPSSLSSSSPSPPAESPGSSRMPAPAQDIYMSPFLPFMLRQQLELQRMWNAASASNGKPLNPSANDWYGEGSVKRLENLMKTFQQQQQQQSQGQQTKVGSANVPLFPYANNRRAK